MNDERVIEILNKSNKWWKEKFEFKFKPRLIYQEIKKFMHVRQIISLTGLRRTGKTTIMLKIVYDNIPKFDRMNIVYFSFDEFRKIKLIEVINAYVKIINKDINKEKYLFLFDEIQKVENWEEQLKRIYDEHSNIKFIISGSESLFIRKKSRESLAGRMFEFQVKILTFKEFLSFKNLKFDNLSLYKEEILREYKNFLFSNGFPEMVGEKREIADKYVKNNVIEKIIYRDIPQIIPVQEPAILEQIFKIILNDPGEIISLDDLAKELRISRQTVSLYIDYLEKSFLIRKLYNFSRNARKTQRKLKKYYPTIISHELVEKNEMSGKVFETFIVNQLDAEFFWRDTYKNEVDIVKINSNILPIEVKISKVEARTLKLFMKKFKVDKGIILTYNTKEKINGVEAIPFYEFLI